MKFGLNTQENTKIEASIVLLKDDADTGIPPFFRIETGHDNMYCYIVITIHFLKTVILSI